MGRIWNRLGLAHNNWADKLMGTKMRCSRFSTERLTFEERNLSFWHLPSSPPSGKSKSEDLRTMEVKNIIKDKKFWFASFLIVWAASLQGHMMWMQRQASFKQKFGNYDQDKDAQN